MANNNLPIITDDQVLPSETSREVSERGPQMVVIPMAKEEWEAYVEKKFGQRPDPGDNLTVN